MQEPEQNITQEVIEAARHNPGGWVYKIEGDFGPQESIPPEAIIGAWKVDAAGNVAGEFLRNPNYKPSFSRTSGAEKY